MASVEKDSSSVLLHFMSKGCGTFSEDHNHVKAANIQRVSIPFRVNSASQGHLFPFVQSRRRLRMNVSEPVRGILMPLHASALNGCCCGFES
jgi:hypothetical protein